MDGFFLSHQNKLGQPQKCTGMLRQRSWLCAASDFLSISAHRTEMRGRLNLMELIQHTNTQKKKPSEWMASFLCELYAMDQFAETKTELQTSEAFAVRRGGATKRVRDDF